MGHIIMQTANAMSVSGKMTKRTDMEYSIFSMETSMEAHGKMAALKVKERFTGLTAAAMRASGKKIKKMDMVSFMIQTEVFVQAGGKMTFCVQFPKNIWRRLRKSMIMENTQAP